MKFIVDAEANVKNPQAWGGCGQLGQHGCGYAATA
jgi:hypothetical protein